MAKSNSVLAATETTCMVMFHLTLCKTYGKTAA